jgi:endonuclease G
LSNWHVLAGSNAARKGDAIVQPGKFDGGRTPQDKVATLERMVLDHDGDCAIALLNYNRAHSPMVLDLNVMVSKVQDPKIGDIVVKSGRTSGVTEGKVDAKGH